MPARHLRGVAFFAASCGALLACGSILGIEDLTADRSPTVPLEDGQASADDVSAAPPTDAPASMFDTAPPVDAASVKRTFLSSMTYDGTFDNHPGIAGADGLCSALAKAARLGDDGNWIAWMSGNGADAATRIVWPGPYYTVTGQLVVRDHAHLANSLLERPISVMENGQTATAATPLAWTGTQSAGASTNVTCNNWTAGNGPALGTAGLFNRIDGKWTDNGGSAPFVPGWTCNVQARLYCFEK